MAINYTYPVKGSPVAADEFLIIDSTDNSTKKVTASSVLSLTTIPATTWGTITGTLSTQTDLQSALNLKANLSGATFTGPVTSPDFIGDLNGAVRFEAKNASGSTLLKGKVVSITGVSGNQTLVGLADADNVLARPAFGLVFANANNNAACEVVTFGNLSGLNTSAFSEGDTLYVSTVAGELVNVAPTGEAADIQNVGKVIRSHTSTGIIKVGGAGRSNATPNLNSAKIFLGNSSNQSVARAVTGEVSLSDAGVTAITSIAGNVSIQGYSPMGTIVTSSYTIQESDFGKTILFTNANSKVVTIDDIEDYPIGSEVSIINYSEANLSVSAINITAVSGGPKITTPYGQGTLKKVSQGQYVFYGQVTA